MLHGIIDIGSNTIRMAIYFIEGQQIEMLMKKKHIVGCHNRLFRRFIVLLHSSGQMVVKNTDNLFFQRKRVRKMGIR